MLNINEFRNMKTLLYFYEFRKREYINAKYIFDFNKQNAINYEITDNDTIFINMHKAYEQMQEASALISEIIHIDHTNSECIQRLLKVLNSTSELKYTFRLINITTSNKHNQKNNVITAIVFVREDFDIDEVINREGPDFLLYSFKHPKVYRQHKVIIYDKLNRLCNEEAYLNEETSLEGFLKAEEKSGMSKSAIQALYESLFEDYKLSLRYDKVKKRKL